MDLFFRPWWVFFHEIVFFRPWRAIMVIERVKVGKSKMNCTIRNMIKSDIESLSHGFMNQGWPAREEILASYFGEQASGDREVLVATMNGVVAGYITILPLVKHGPFAEVYP